MPSVPPLRYRYRWHTLCRSVQEPFVHPHRPKPAEEKTPYSYQPFLRSRHVADIETIEIRGMYKEEIRIERGKFPTYNKVWWIHTDGSLSLREVEYNAPSFITLFRDGAYTHRERRENLARRKGRSAYKSWEHNSASRLETSSIPMVDMNEFPYCVPSHHLREAIEQE